jgi:uncharacterized protein YcbK (DUF882 family)
MSLRLPQERCMTINSGAAHCKEKRSTDLRFTVKSSVHQLAKVAMAATLVLGGVLISLQDTQTAIANGDTRTISLYHTHRKDQITVTFKRGGYYDKGALSKLNYFLRDWRNDAQTTMDPRLFDVVWEAYSSVGYRGNIHVVSAYRSPATNAMLRRRSRGVAKNSQHMQGKAMDTTVPGLGMARVREMGMRLQMGGVGYYPRSRSPFVHLDVGNVRSWPRMSRSQLAKLFPDGRTVHLPREGGTMPGYQLALSDIQRFGRGVGGPEGEDGDGGRNFFGALFGGGTDGDAENYDDGEAQTPLQVLMASKRQGKKQEEIRLAALQAEENQPKQQKRAPKVAVPPAEPAAPAVAKEPDPLVAPAAIVAAPKIPEGKKEPEPELPETALALADPQSLEPKLKTADLVAVPMPPRKPRNFDALVQLAEAEGDATEDGIPLPPRKPSELVQIAAADEVTASLEEPKAAPGQIAAAVDDVTPEIGTAVTLRPGAIPRPLAEEGDTPKLAKGEPPPLRVASLEPQVDAAQEGETIVRSLIAQSNSEKDKQTKQKNLPDLIIAGQEGDAAPAETVALADVPLPPARPKAVTRNLADDAPKAKASQVAALKIVPRADLRKKEDDAPKKVALKIDDQPALRSDKPKKKLKLAPVIAGQFKKVQAAPDAGAFTGSVVRSLDASFIKGTDGFQ